VRDARAWIEPRRRQPGKARFCKLRAIEFAERRGDGVKAERTALFQDDAGELAPHFNDERFGDGLHHGLNLLLDLYMVTMRRSGNGEGCQMSPFIEQITRVRHQYGGRNFYMRRRRSRHDERMTERCPFDCRAFSWAGLNRDTRWARREQCCEPMDKMPSGPSRSRDLRSGLA